MPRLADEWEARSGDWARWARTPGHDHHFLRFNWPAFADLLPAPGRATLDLGCGEGRCGALLAELGHRVTGVDVAPSMVTMASETGAYVDVLEADAGRLPFTDGAFDLVLAFMSLHDMDNPGAAIAEAARVLAAGGRLAVAIVHPIASAHLGRDRGEHRPYFDVARTEDEVSRDGIAFTFHQVHRPLEDWVRMLSGAGFLVEGLREPRPSAQDAGDRPDLAKSRVTPAFLHLLCVQGR